MKRSIILIALAAVALTTSGCATIKAPTQAQLTQVCTNTQMTISELQAMQTLPAAVQTNLAVIEPIVTGACSVGTVDVTSLGAFNATVFPALQKAIDAGVTDAVKHDQLAGLVLAAQIIVGNMAAGL